MKKLLRFIIFPFLLVTGIWMIFVIWIIEDEITLKEAFDLYYGALKP